MSQLVCTCDVVEFFTNDLFGMYVLVITQARVPIFAIWHEGLHG